MTALPDGGFRLAAKDTLDRCHDKPVAQREDLFAHPKERQSGLLGDRCDARSRIHLTSPACRQKCTRRQANPWQGGLDSYARTRRQPL